MDSITDSRISEGSLNEAYVSATTISTIVVQGGPLQLVIALLRDGSILHIKVAELIPKLSFLGANLDEALNLQKQHEELLLNIQNLPTPLEEFYQKIQEKIASNETQNPKLIETMADSLNQVWSDIQKVLHDRRLIISLNVMFFEILGECYGKMSSLEVACRDTMIPIEVDAVKDFLEKFKFFRTDVLSVIMNALTIGNQLLEQLKEVANVGTLDSRPNQIQVETVKSVNQVQLWLEDLSDKRNALEIAWTSRKSQLDQCLGLAELAKDLSELEKMLNKQRDEILGSFDLGDSKHSAYSMMQDYSTWKVDAAALRDRSLKITKATQAIMQKGNFTGDEACSKAYTVLSSCTEYLDEIDLRHNLLQQSQEFFIRAENVLAELNALEAQVGNMRPGSPNLIPMHLKLLKKISTTLEEVLQFGYSLIDEVGRTKPEVQGVKAVVDEMENRKLIIENKFSASSEKHFKVSEELNKFLEEYNDIFSWLEYQKREKIINGSINQMGINSHQAKECLYLHQQLLSNIETKGNEINNLHMNLSPYRESLEDEQREDVDSKIASLKQNWSDLKNFVFARVGLIEIYSQFHHEAENLSNLFNNLEQTLKTRSQPNDFKYIDSVWSKIQIQFTYLKKVGKQFNDESVKVADPYIQADCSRASNCIEKILNEFSSRQLEISNVWENWNIRNEVHIILEQIMAENVETTTLAAKIEDELYPILASSSNFPGDLIKFVEKKLVTVGNEIKNAEHQLLQRIEKVDQLEAKDDASNDKIVQVKNNLNSVKTKLFTISADYNELVDIMLIFLKSVNNCHEKIGEYFTKKQHPLNENNVEGLIQDYEMFKNSTMEHFRSLLTQSEKIIDRVKMQEPPGSKEHDTDKIISLLEQLRIYFETNASSENSELKRQHFIKEFERELNDIHENLVDLSRQGNDFRKNFGESAASVKVSSLSFEYFERNVELVNKRIEHMNKTIKINNAYPDAQSYIDSETEKLIYKWKEFAINSDELKRLFNSANEYNHLLEIIESRYHKTYTFLVGSANLKKNDLKTSSSAFELIDEIENYVIENKHKQFDDLDKLSKISINLYGLDKTDTLLADNVFIFQSFEKIKSDIVEIVKNLKEQENPIILSTSHPNVLEKEIVSTPIQVIDEPLFESSVVIENTELKVENVHEIIPVIEFEPPQFAKPLSDIVVDEGDRVVFICFVKGYPEPTIDWQKDQVSVGNNTDYKTSYDNGFCKLEIDESFASDSATFSCIASNSAGVCANTAKLMVNENKPEVFVAPPFFITPLENAYATQDQPFELSFLVAGNPLPTVQWFKNNICIDNSSDHYISYNNGYGVLKFDRIRMDNEATYTCKATNQLGSIECSGILSVESVEQLEIPQIVIPLSNVMARVGQKIKLECQVAGVPTPALFWTHDGKSFADRDARFQFDQETATLTILEAFLKDAGVYSLSATNSAGTATTTCSVIVKGRQPNETSDSDVTNDVEFELIKPSVQLPLKDISIFEGKGVRLDCVIVGQPEPEVIWYHDHRPVKESNEIQLLFQGDRCSLIIQEAFIEDAGEYKVAAINSAGEAFSHCRLSITPLNISEPAIRPSSEQQLLVEMPPKFEKLLSDIFVIENDAAVLECTVISMPKPDIKWFHNNKEIIYSERIHSSFKDDGTIKLVIQNVIPDDKGVYTIKATNSSGDAKCFSNLIVKSNTNGTDMPSTFEPEEKSVCPTFKELFADRSVAFDDSTKFECIVVGKPTPKVKWFFNDVPVHGKDFLISTSGDRQVLSILNVKHQNIGKISCIAENEIGKATCVAILSLHPVGAEPMESQEQFTTQEDVSGSSFITMQKHITTTTTTKHMENGSSSFHSSGAKYDHSFKKQDDQPAQITESNQFEEFREVTEQPPQTFQQKLISFTKHENTNKHESIIANSGQISTGKPIRRHIAPRFVSPFVGKIVDQGTNVILEGIIDGYPVPEISIQKNDEKLENSPGKVNISYSLNKIVIELLDVNVKDAGRYSCVASNEAGSSTSTADVVVKKSVFPPVFGRRLQAQVVKKDDRVLMDVEITGTPEPKVTWFKNDLPLDSSMVSEYSLQQVGISYKLIIDNVQLADSGKYKVIAVNAGGESQSIADFMVLEPQTSPEQIRKEPIAETQTGSTTESVITETRRTTESTMKMEHKMDFPDMPISFTQRTKTPTSVQVPNAPNPHEFGATAGNQGSIYHAKFVPDPLAEPIQFEPIKQNAFEFFENNLKNIGPNNEEKYTRYEDMVKTKSSTVRHGIDNQQFQSQLDKDLTQLHLEPGSPPLEGFMPKTVFKQDKIPSMEPPSNGVYPQATSFRKVEIVEENCHSSSFKTFAPVQRMTPKLEPIRMNRSPSPRPSTEALEMEKLWTTKSPEPHLAQSFMASQQSFQQENHKSFVAYSTPPQHLHPAQICPEQNFVAPEAEPPKLSIKETKKMFEGKIRHEELSILKSPALVKECVKPDMAPPSQFQPGAPPEICYASKPIYERKQSQVERIEKSLEESLDKEPSYVPRGGVRIIPVRQPTPQRTKFSQSPSRSRVSPSPQPTFSVRAITPPSFETIQSSFDSKMSSKISKEHISSAYVAPAFTPITPLEAKLDSAEAANLQGYRKVVPPQLSDRPKSVEPQAVPPTQFEIPKASEAIFRPLVQVQAARPEPVIKKLEPIYPPVLNKADPLVQQPKPINPSQFNKITGGNSLYKSFVKSEERVESSESYFRQIDMKSPTPKLQDINPKIQSPSPVYGQQEYKTSTLSKNIIMTKQDSHATYQSATKVVAPPSPSTFQKREFTPKPYESPKIESVWHSSSDATYKSVHPILLQNNQQKYTLADKKIPSPPSSFENPPYMTTPKPFEPIDKANTTNQQQPARCTRSEPKQQPIYKPTPVTPARTNSNGNYTTDTSHLDQVKSYYYTTGPQTQTTTYYTGVAGQPVHNTVATETSNTMHMKESSEKSQRVVNITQTRRIISLDNSLKESFETKLEPFPYSADHDYNQYRQRVPPPPTPTKFVPGEFRDSDYDSEFDASKIRPLWTPNPSDNDEPQYRRVRPPSQQSRSSSVPRYFDRILTPMEFDTQPVQMPSKINVECPIKTPQQYFTSALYQNQSNVKTVDHTTHHESKTVTRDDIDVRSKYAPNSPKPIVMHKASHQVDHMNNAFKTKAHQFMKDVITDVNQTRPILKKANSINEQSNAQAYREESRVSQYGTKHVDPDTGIIYFKYDFGYEFGIIFPGEGKKIIGGIRNVNDFKQQNQAVPLRNPRAGDIEVPVIHEKSGTPTKHFECDVDAKARKRHSLQSPNFYERSTPKYIARGDKDTTDYSQNSFDRSATSTPLIINQQQKNAAKKPPIFITPLKDVAIFNGQTARFECIVQCDPHPRVMWTKNGVVVSNSQKHIIEFRNGVCRLTIMQCYPDDAATYTCLANNPIGSDSTSGILMVPGDKRGTRK